MDRWWRSVGTVGRIVFVVFATVSIYALSTLAVKLFDSRRQREDPEQPPPQPLPPEQVPAYRLYSERQVLLTTALFSPLAGGVLLWANLRKLRQRGSAWLALLYGPALTACFVGLAVVVAQGESLPTRRV